ncbi:MAG: hypothetical protein H6719_10815 [Sandaracinaceae bacterium]|nr:hypothetical protein [Sandaracinaceae bacterium]
MTRPLAALLAAVVSVSSVAFAQDAGVDTCDDLPLQRPQETFPADRAPSVSIDAPLRIRYTPGYFGPTGPGGDPTRLLEVRRCTRSACDFFACDDTAEFVPGRVQVLGDELVYFPDAGWETAATYTGIARGRDDDLTFSFCTGSSSDDLPPVLGEIDEIRTDPIEPRCDAPDGGYRVGVFFRPATDSGPPGSIEYLLFQTRGADVDAPILRDRVRNYAGEQITMAFVLPPDEAGSPICVRVAAVDGVGNLDFSDLRDGQEECLDPVQGNFFYGLCSATAPGSGGASPLVGLVALGLLGALRIRRRR